MRIVSSPAILISMQIRFPRSFVNSREMKPSLRNCTRSWSRTKSSMSSPTTSWCAAPPRSSPAAIFVCVCVCTIQVWCHSTVVFLSVKQKWQVHLRQRSQTMYAHCTTFRDTLFYQKSQNADKKSCFGVKKSHSQKIISLPQPGFPKCCSLFGFVESPISLNVIFAFSIKNTQKCQWGRFQFHDITIFMVFGFQPRALTPSPAFFPSPLFKRVSG